jgi:hypothetical protein
MGQSACAPCAEQLALPLESEPERAAPPALPSLTGGGSSVNHEAPADWSSEEQVVLHGVLLERNLRTLSYRSRAEDRRDVLRWIFKPDVAHFTVRGRRFTQRQDDVPFSFRRCCRLSGYDADELRDSLRVLLKRRGIEVPAIEAPGVE